MTTPFSPLAVAYPGIDPGTPAQPQYGSRRFWLGKPGSTAGMIELPSKVQNYQAPATRGEVQQNLYGGAVGVNYFANVARTWTLEFPYLVGRDWQVVNGFYRRYFGAGPWVFVPPEDVNRLTGAQSMCGDASQWAASAGTVTVDGSAAPIVPCGVLRWAGATTGSKLAAAAGFVSGSPSVDTTRAAPCLAAEPTTVACQVKTATGSAVVEVVAAGFDVNGAVVSQGVLTSVTASSAGWAPLAATVSPGGLGSAVYVALELVCNTASAPDILVSVPNLSYTDYVPDWEAGCGVPRVVWPTAPGRALSRTLASSATMTLAEAILGAV